MEAMKSFDIKMTNGPSNRDSKYVLDNWLRVDPQLLKIDMPNEIGLMIDSYFYAGDEWNACGKNLQINPNNNHNKVVNIGSKDINLWGMSVSKGSAYGLQIVCPPSENDDKDNNKQGIGEYYWKLRMGPENEYTFAVGFVKEEHGIKDCNKWCFNNEHAIGIYSDTEIWSNGDKLSDDGIQFKARDIVNLCIDYNRKGVYVQRLEYLEDTYGGYKQISDDDDDDDDDMLDDGKRADDDFDDNQIITDVGIPRNFIIGDVKKVFGGIDVESNYRLACYLRKDYQNVEIIKFSTQPFVEWTLEES